MRALREAEVLGVVSFMPLVGAALLFLAQIPKIKNRKGSYIRDILLGQRSCECCLGVFVVVWRVVEDWREKVFQLRKEKRSQTEQRKLPRSNDM